MIEKGASINEKDRYGSTPLHKACVEGHLEIIEELLDRRAEVKYDKDGKIIMENIPDKHRLKVREFLDSYAERGCNIKPAKRF